MQLWVWGLDLQELSVSRRIEVWGLQPCGP